LVEKTEDLEDSAKRLESNVSELNSMFWSKLAIPNSRLLSGGAIMLGGFLFLNNRELSHGNVPFNLVGSILKYGAYLTACAAGLKYLSDDTHSVSPVR
jgi:hypothetical protein